MLQVGGNILLQEEIQALSQAQEKDDPGAREVGELLGSVFSGAPLDENQLREVYEKAGISGNYCTHAAFSELKFYRAVWSLEELVLYLKSVFKSLKNVLAEGNCLFSSRLHFEGLMTSWNIGKSKQIFPPDVWVAQIKSINSNVWCFL